MTSFPISLAVEHDEEASTVAVVAYAGEARFVTHTIRLRPEHNSPVDALRIMLNPDVSDQYDYDNLEEASR